eukprot:12901187-Prorocentrum_lima.AAC.1
MLSRRRQAPCFPAEVSKCWNRDNNAKHCAQCAFGGGPTVVRVCMWHGCVTVCWRATPRRH